ncbi:GCN5-related N-acetyltransferase [Rhodopirellula maiorica SM1]|uniref:GCN5-related N-acetyltransferase n=1 Tax=Rhodopirellula maiorica SM1 TaxID=1265738 RepID=M5RK79_9BACT|nr:N-acetyltransferase [Rhodopirellula maiorica]EMI15772.1 GCN5-related N-acetyltransferase [Rhodopirellula maiorica SM1]
MNITLRPERTEDRQSIWNVNHAAFGNDAEANLVDALRKGGFATVSVVAEIDGEIVGHILFSPVSILTSDQTIAAVSLAPMAVQPRYQRQGIGSKLVQSGLQSCRDQGCQIAVVLGHPKFYSRFGFSSDLARPLESPFGGGEAWMAIELVSGALSGVTGSVQYSPPFTA